VTPPHVGDSGKIVLGELVRVCHRLTLMSADQSKIRLGAGVRLPAERKTA
jgi:hypothetical protein